MNRKYEKRKYVKNGKDRELYREAEENKLIGGSREVYEHITNHEYEYIESKPKVWYSDGRDWAF